MTHSTDSDSPSEALTPATCTQCSRKWPRSELVCFEQELLCTSCKPVFFQKLREGWKPDQSTKEKRGRPWLIRIIFAYSSSIVCAFVGMMLGGLIGTALANQGVSLSISSATILIAMPIPLICLLAFIKLRKKITWHETGRQLWLPYALLSLIAVIGLPLTIVWKLIFPRSSIDPSGPFFLFIVMPGLFSFFNAIVCVLLAYATTIYHWIISRVHK